MSTNQRGMHNDDRNANSCLTYCTECWEECVFCECDANPGDLEEETSLIEAYAEFESDLPEYKPCPLMGANGQPAKRKRRK